MIDSKANKEPQLKIAVGPKSFPGKTAMMPLTVPSPDVIRSRAYELYENRGREPGQDEQDWLRAEQETLKLER